VIQTDWQTAGTRGPAGSFSLFKTLPDESSGRSIRAFHMFAAETDNCGSNVNENEGHFTFHEILLADIIECFSTEAPE